MEAFLELVGSYKILGFTVRDLCLFIAAAAFVYKKIYKGTWIPYYESQKKKDSMLQETFDEVKKYHEFRVHDREQSFEIQRQLTDSIKSIGDKQGEIQQRLEELDERNKRYERSSTRNTLLQAYRFYSSEYSNPQQAWTEMEAHAFWEQFSSYEDAGGDDYMHTDVQPAMNRLLVIPMNDIARISALVKSREK